MLVFTIAIFMGVISNTNAITCSYGTKSDNNAEGKKKFTFKVDDEVTAGEEFGAVESVKAASDLISPVSGTVVEVNDALDDQPELVNQDAFANWIIKVEMSDKSELDNLMDAKAYAAFCEK